MASHIGRRKFLATLGGAATCPLAAAFALPPAVSRPALAQGWPARPVRIVVPYAPGGSTDTVARITADRLSRIWGQQVLIENKPGAGTNLAAAAAYRRRWTAGPDLGERWSSRLVATAEEDRSLRDSSVSRSIFHKRRRKIVVLILKCTGWNCCAPPSQQGCRHDQQFSAPAIP